MKVRISVGSIRWESEEFGPKFSAEDEHKELSDLLESSEQEWSEPTIELVGGTMIERAVWDSAFGRWEPDGDFDMLYDMFQVMDYVNAGEEAAAKVLYLLEETGYADNADELLGAAENDMFDEYDGWLRAAVSSSRKDVIYELAMDVFDNLPSGVLRALDPNKLELEWTPDWLREFGGRWYAVDKQRNISTDC